MVDFLESDEGERERNLTLLDAFEAKLREHRPELAQLIDQKRIDKEMARLEKEEEEQRAKNKKKSSLWARLTS